MHRCSAICKHTQKQDYSTFKKGRCKCFECKCAMNKSKKVKISVECYNKKRSSNNDNNKKVEWEIDFAA